MLPGVCGTHHPLCHVAVDGVYVSPDAGFARLVGRGDGRVLGQRVDELDVVAQRAQEDLRLVESPLAEELAVALRAAELRPPQRDGLVS